MIASRTRLFLTLASLLAVVQATFAACGSSDECGGECFRAVSCVAACGEEPVQVGCCPCPQGTFDDLQCTADAGDGG